MFVIVVVFGGLVSEAKMSLYFFGRPDVRRGRRGGGGKRMASQWFFPITFIVHNQMSNGGPMGDLMV